MQISTVFPIYDTRSELSKKAAKFAVIAPLRNGKFSNASGRRRRSRSSHAKPYEVEKCVNGKIMFPSIFRRIKICLVVFVKPS